MTDFEIDFYYDLAVFLGLIDPKSECNRLTAKRNGEIVRALAAADKNGTLKIA